jgi:hypothetical protein
MSHPLLHFKTVFPLLAVNKNFFLDLALLLFSMRTLLSISCGDVTVQRESRCALHLCAWYGDEDAMGILEMRERVEQRLLVYLVGNRMRHDLFGLANCVRERW